MANWAGVEKRHYDAVDSTNKQARLWARQGAPHGAVITAKTQTAGRGRQNHQWESAPSAGLWLSIILRPTMSTCILPLLSFAMALATADACTNLTGHQVQLKWPNDLLLYGKKIVGILLEREGDAVIVGIGINVSQEEKDFPLELRNKAASLKMQTDVSISLEQLEKDLLAEIERRMDIQDFMPEYQQRCITIGSKVQVITTFSTFDGTAIGVSSEGALLVIDANGITHTVYAGEVSIRGVTGYV